MSFNSDPQATSTRALRLQVAEGLSPQQQNAVAPAVLRSWERAQRAGLRPADRALYTPAATSATCRRLEEEHQSLISCATQDMQRLRRSFGSSNWVVLLANAQGTVVSSVGHELAATRELREPLRIGKDLREESLGTNAPACALTEGVSTTVLGSEHYLDELQYYSCAAAPIHHPNGQIVGVLDVTGWQVRPEQDILRRVVMSARSIENRLLKVLPGVAILQLHHDDRLLGTPLEGLLAVDGDGRVVASNAAAAKMLGSGGGRGFQGLSLLDLIQEGSTALLAEHGRAAAAARFVRTREGSGLFVRWDCSPAPAKAASAAGPRARPSVAPPEALDLSAIRAPFEKALRVVQHGLPVLIQGETGTGKEVFARQLHARTRGDTPFVAVNCSALPDGLIESELFGYVDGAFTGARRGGASGKLAQADGGTLFLDEIGDMPLGLQTRLLRVLQERAFVPVGGDRPVPIDLQVLAATHRDVSALVAQGAFREDLYYRLAGYVVHLPALRERADLKTLITQELLRIDPDVRLDATVWERLLTYRWPGNLRQLVQTLRATVALCDHPQRIVQPGDLPLLPGEHDTPHACTSPAPRTTGPAAASRFGDLKQQAIDEALLRHGGNVSAVARELKLSRTTVYSYVQRARH